MQCMELSIDRMCGAGKMPVTFLYHESPHFTLQIVAHFQAERNEHVRSVNIDDSVSKHTKPIEQ